MRSLPSAQHVQEDGTGGPLASVLTTSGVLSIRYKIYSRRPTCVFSESNTHIHMKLTPSCLPNPGPWLFLAFSTRGHQATWPGPPAGGGV